MDAITIPNPCPKIPLYAALMFSIPADCLLVIHQALGVVCIAPKRTGEKHIWLRATGSTLVSQFIDSFIVLIIAFYFYPKWVPNQGSPWPVNQVIAIGIVNYIYKFFVAILLTPVIYLVHNRIEKYLGHDLSGKMKRAAMESQVIDNR